MTNTKNTTVYKVVYEGKLPGMDPHIIEGETIFNDFNTAVEIGRQTVEASTYDISIKYIKAINFNILEP